MTTQDEQSLKNEIQHIFDSGANEVRILEMVKSFIEKRGKHCIYTMLATVLIIPVDTEMVGEIAVRMLKSSDSIVANG